MAVTHADSGSAVAAGAWARRLQLQGRPLARDLLGAAAEARQMTELARRSSPSVPLIIGGVISVFFGIFHLAFWHFFDWKTALAPLSPMNRAIMKVLNVHVAYTVLVFGCLSVLRSREFVGTRLGRSVSFFIAAFWLLRAVNEVVFFDNPRPQALALVATFIGTGLLYAVPAWRARSSAVEAAP
jgi:hypothetical protein